MNPNISESREFITQAREALKSGDRESARDLGEKAALLTPDMEDAWLVLTAADSNPEDALAYAQKALELNPESLRARKAVQWAMGQLNWAKAGNMRGAAETAKSVRDEAPAPRPVKRAAKETSSPAGKKSNNRSLIYVAALLGLIICIALGFAAWSAINNPASAINDNASGPENHWAQMNIPKPSVTPIDVSAFAQPTSVAVLPSAVVADTPTSAPTNVPTLAPTDIPTSIPSEAPTAIPEATETPGVMAMDILADTPTSVYVPPTDAPNIPPVVAASHGGNGGARWIDVNLSTQSVYAYEGDTVVNSFIVSTGTALTPTVTGKYKIYVKYEYANMSGPGYFLPDVPYVMYFYKGYGLHGTYWHHNFGTPMSHGCVNLETGNAGWLFNWASVGTVVNVHY